MFMPGEDKQIMLLPTGLFREIHVTFARCVPAGSVPVTKRRWKSSDVSLKPVRATDSYLSTVAFATA